MTRRLWKKVKVNCITFKKLRTMGLPIMGNRDSDIAAPGGKKWMYTPEVKEHFFHPKNLLENTGEINEDEYDGYGQVGSPACGDMMKLWIKVNNKTDRITDCKWQTFGCASAIASTSMMSMMVTESEGMTTEEAMGLTPQMIMERLGGLPPRKVHCSVLGDKALVKAVNDYYRRSGQIDRMKIENAKIIDPGTNVTDKDIEEAVLEGAKDLESLQAKLKVAIGNPAIIPELEKTMNFYIEKYYGD